VAALARRTYVPPARERDGSQPQQPQTSDARSRCSFPLPSGLADGGARILRVPPGGLCLPLPIRDREGLTCTEMSDADTAAPEQPRGGATRRPEDARVTI